MIKLRNLIGRMFYKLADWIGKEEEMELKEIPMTDEERKKTREVMDMWERNCRERDEKT